MSDQWDDWGEDRYPPPPEPPPGGSAADYPYDPAADVYALEGLDKLRAVADRRTAQDMYDLFWVLERRHRDPKARAEATRQAQQREHTRRFALVRAVLRGRYGKPAVELAQRIVLDESGNLREDWRTLEEFEAAFKRLGAETRRAS